VEDGIHWRQKLLPQQNAKYPLRNAPADGKVGFQIRGAKGSLLLLAAISPEFAASGIRIHHLIQGYCRWS
jgi:hypothetical protein